jgi:hypothetical protein
MTTLAPLSPRSRATAAQQLLPGAKPLSNQWSCPACRLVNSLSVPACRCGRARPMESGGDWPGIFSGMVFHFNGVIPRTLKHPSHSIEWRMAEAHGAKVTADFPERVTHLIYRPGYERSEKVRMAITRLGIRCMPVAWLLDSMLQSRELFENLYKLQAIPSQALPTAAGVMLAHYQHPFYVAHAEQFAIPGLDGGGPESAAMLKRGGAVGGAGGDAGGGESVDPAGFPKMQAIPEVVPRVAASHYPTSNCNPVLFSGLTVFFTFPATEGDGRDRAIERAGGRVATQTMDGATHIVYDPNDRKGELMQAAAVFYDSEVAKGDAGSPPAIVTVSWLLDCFFLDEILPAAATYIPKEKLMQTLRKKAARAK